MGVGPAGIVDHLAIWPRRCSNEFGGHPGGQAGVPMVASAGAPDGGWLHRYERHGRTSPYNAHRTRCRADVSRRAPDLDGVRPRHDRSSRPARNAPSGVWPPQLQLRLAVQQQPGTPRTVCRLKIRYIPGPSALSRLSAEGLALRLLFRSGRPSYGPFGLLVRTAREHVRPIARSNDRPDAARKRAI